MKVGKGVFSFGFSVLFLHTADSTPRSTVGRIVAARTRERELSPIPTTRRTHTHTYLSTRRAWRAPMDFR